MELVDASVAHVFNWGNECIVAAGLDVSGDAVALLGSDVLLHVGCSILAGAAVGDNLRGELN